MPPSKNAAKIEVQIELKVARKAARPDKELQSLHEVEALLVSLLPVWALPPDKLAEYLAHDSSAKFVKERIAPLLRGACR